MSAQKITAILASPRFDLDGDLKITASDVFEGSTTRFNQIVRLEDGSVGLDVYGRANVGDEIEALPFLVAGSADTMPTSWTPTPGATCLGMASGYYYRNDEDRYVEYVRLIERVGTGSTATYLEHPFEWERGPDGSPTACIAMARAGQTLTLTDVLRLELGGSDFNADNLIGEAVTAVLASPRLDIDDDGRISAADAIQFEKPDGSSGTVAAKGEGLLRLTSGGIGVTESSSVLEVGTPVGFSKLLQVRNGEAVSNWAPSTAAGVSYLGVAELPAERVTIADPWDPDGTIWVSRRSLMTIERTGSGATATYRGYVFADELDEVGNNTGVATLQATQSLTLTDVLRMESLSSQDFTGDNLVGEAVAAVLASPRQDTTGDGRITAADVAEFEKPDGSLGTAAAKGLQLVRLTSGAIGIDDSGLLGTGAPARYMMTLQVRSGDVVSNWTPSTAAGVSYLGAADLPTEMVTITNPSNPDGAYEVERHSGMVIERTGSGGTATYRGYVFADDLDAFGDPTGTTTLTSTQSLTLTDVLRLESSSGQDFNADNLIGEAVTAVLASPRLDTTGDGKITAADLLEFEKPDGSLGTAAAKGLQLVRLTSGAIGLDDSGLLATGAPAGDMMTLQVRSGDVVSNWTPSTAAGVSYLGVAELPPQMVTITDPSSPDNAYEVEKHSGVVIERTGSGATATYRGYVFADELDEFGNPIGGPKLSGTQSLTLTDVLRLESSSGQDFNADNLIGEAVTAVLASPRLDTTGDGKITAADLLEFEKPDGSLGTAAAKGLQLVKLTSGVIGIDESGLLGTGAPAGEVVTLQVRSGQVVSNWTPSTAAGVSYLGVAELPPQTVTITDPSSPDNAYEVEKHSGVVIERTGSGATATYRGYVFADDLDSSGNTIGGPKLSGTQSLTLTDVLRLESSSGQDFNADNLIGDSITAILASPRLDVTGDGRITAADVTEFEKPDGTTGTAAAKGPQVVKLLSGAIAIDASGLAATNTAPDDIVVLRSKASVSATTSTNWAASTVAGTSYLGVVDRSTDEKSQFMLVEKTGTTSSATYKGYLFVNDVDADGNLTGTATVTGTVGQTALSLTDLLRLESRAGVDFNGDNLIGNAVTSVLASPRFDANGDGRISTADIIDGVTAKGAQLVRLASGVAAVDFDGTAAVGSGSDDMPVLRTKAAATAAATNWTASTVAGVSYVGVVDRSTSDKSQFMLVEKTGTTSTATYKGYLFVNDVDSSGNPIGTATVTGTVGQATLSLTDLLKLETAAGIDMNGDSTIGDAVASVLAAGARRDANGDGSINSADTLNGAAVRGAQLVKLSSGGIAVDLPGTATSGAAAGDMPVLRTKAAATAAATNWVASTVAGAYQGVIESDDGETLTVVERTGTTATSASRVWQFSKDYNEAGDWLGTATMSGTAAQTLSSTQLLSLESQSGLDLNGDGIVKLAVVRQGTANAERLVGDVGNDTLIGGAGRDTLAGGLGADRFVFSDIDDSNLPVSRVTDVIEDFSVTDDVLEFALDGAAGIRVRGTYASVQSFAKAADKLLDGRVKVVFGTVGSDGYVAVDNDGTGVTHLVQLVGVKQMPSIVFPDVS